MITGHCSAGFHGDTCSAPLACSCECHPGVAPRNQDLPATKLCAECGDRLPSRRWADRLRYCPDKDCAARAGYRRRRDREKANA